MFVTLVLPMTIEPLEPTVVVKFKLAAVIVPAAVILPPEVMEAVLEPALARVTLRALFP
jgi:hypothetical protein